MKSNNKHTHLPLINRIRAQIQQMTPAVRNVATIVCEDPKAATSYTIQDLADKANTSISSVVRFCREVGFSNLVEIRLAIAQEIARQDTESLNHKQNLSPLVKLKCELANVMDVAVDFMNEQSLDAIAEQALKANRIICFGIGASHTAADFLYCRLLRLGLNAFSPSDTHIAHMHVYGSKADDIIFFFSASGNTPEILRSAQYAKERKLTSIGIINCANTSLEKICDISTIVGVPENFISSGELSTKLGAFMFGEAFIRTLIQKDEQLRLMYENAASALVNKESNP